MVRVLRLRPVQRRPEDWRDIVQVMFSQVLSQDDSEEMASPMVE